jgi:Na+/proline symporter
MDIFTLTIAVSLVLFIAIGNYAGKNVKHLDDYFVAGRRAPTILIVGPGTEWPTPLDYFIWGSLSISPGALFILSAFGRQVVI